MAAYEFVSRKKRSQQQKRVASSLSLINRTLFFINSKNQTDTSDNRLNLAHSLFFLKLFR